MLDPCSAHSPSEAEFPGAPPVSCSLHMLLARSVLGSQLAPTATCIKKKKKKRFVLTYKCHCEAKTHTHPTI